MTTNLLISGAVGAAGFVVLALIQGVVRRDYRPSYHTVSALALGEHGWVQTANFLVAGTLITAGAIGLRSVMAGTRGGLVGPLVIGVFGLALVASGVWRMDPMRGYPPGTPSGSPTAHSRAHQLHDHAGAVVFASVPVAGVALALHHFSQPGSTGWALYSLATAIVSAVLFMGFGEAWERDAPRTGALQRLAIGIGWTWVALIFVQMVP